MTGILVFIVAFFILNSETYTTKYKPYEKANAKSLMFSSLIGGFLLFVAGLLMLSADISAGGIVLTFYAFYLWYKYPVQRRR